MVKKICEQCGESFEAKRSTARFCQTKCRVAFNRAAKKIVVKKICIVCGNEFIQKHGNQEYCSDECSETARIITQTHNNFKRWEIYSDDDGSWID
jgi:predicted nucleic acid-binding Zn ribbon protein